MKIGIGYDAHKLVAGRDLVLGGVNIPYKKGLLGHSDADVLVHAIADALLGAARLGDIGEHFPDSDPRYKDVDSLILLKKVAKFIHEEQLQILDIDCVITAEAPKLSPYRDQMRQNIAIALDIDISCIGIKATTTEGMGFTGQGEGISSQAIVLLDF